MDRKFQCSRARKITQQEPFTRVAPLLKAALLLGTGGGFVLAAVLTLSLTFSFFVGPWWVALAQAHGHLQLYGWASLFVIGVAFHFLPRLLGAPLVAPWLVSWILGALVSGLLLRSVSQPLVVITGASFWRLLLLISGVLEMLAILAAILLFALTAHRGLSHSERSSVQSILPFVIGAFSSLGLASLLNVSNTLYAALGNGFMPLVGNDLSIALGLLGFLVPMALAMSARSLPMYAGLQAFPLRVLWPLTGCYLSGLVLYCLGRSAEAIARREWGSGEGLGLVLIGGAIFTFVCFFLFLMRKRGRLPVHVARLAHAPEEVAQYYRAHIASSRQGYGPFVALVASSYLWALVGSLLLAGNGLAYLLGAKPFVSMDIIRHLFAVGFITLLICGIAPRMLSGFSARKITSPRLVVATLYLGNLAVLLRGIALLAFPLRGVFPDTGPILIQALFGLSGPVGLILIITLAWNLWPTLTQPRASSA